MADSPFRPLAALAALLLCGLAAFAADPPGDTDFAYWQGELLGKASGVYERGESVFVVSRVPVTPKTRAQAREAAMLESSALMRDWAFRQMRRERGTEPRRSAEISKMAVVNDRLCPGWRIPPWQIDVVGRQFPPREISGFYHQGQVFRRAALLAAIPDSYRRHPFDEEVVAAFAKISAIIRKNTQ